MTIITTMGLVIRQQTVSEKDKLLTILTGKMGVIYAFAQGAKQMKSKLFSATQVFTYSRLQIVCGREKYIVKSAELMESFGGLRGELSRLSLAHYFADVARQIAPQEVEAEDLLRLFLNCLYFVATGKRDIQLMKSIFELRSMEISGLTPQLDECVHCGKAMEEGYFSNQAGGLVCEDCRMNRSLTYLNPSILKAMRYICQSDFSKLFSFTLSNNAASMLSLITEKYLISQTGKRFKTLDFFKEVLEEPKEIDTKI